MEVLKMAYTEKDIEDFIAGSDEIDRKRAGITLIVTTLEKFLAGVDTKRRRRDVLRVHDEGGRLIFRLTQGGLPIPLDEIEIYGQCYDPYAGKRRGITIGQALPYLRVPGAYGCLPRIVDAANNAYPELGIKEHFDWFIAQASTLRT